MCVQIPGPWFNTKMTSYQYRKSYCGDKMILRPSYLHNGISYTGKMYRKSHCGDKTIVRPSYLHNGISYAGKMTSLYWIGALEVSHPDTASVSYETDTSCSLNWLYACFRASCDNHLLDWIFNNNSHFDVLLQMWCLSGWLRCTDKCDVYLDDFNVLINVMFIWMTSMYW